MSYSAKQKLNVKSSTEAELVGADDMLCKALFCRYFIEAQGYSVEQNIMFQDNQATMRLEVNGRVSSSKRTKHIKSRFFFITDKIASGDLDVQYLPTEKMWSDVLNKPKQGKGFRLDRSLLMNCPIEYDDAVERRRTHPKLLAFEHNIDSANKRIEGPPIHRRSVLGKARIARDSSVAGSATRRAVDASQ